MLVRGIIAPCCWCSVWWSPTIEPPGNCPKLWKLPLGSDLRLCFFRPMALIREKDPFPASNPVSHPRCFLFLLTLFLVIGAELLPIASAAFDSWDWLVQSYPKHVPGEGTWPSGPCMRNEVWEPTVNVVPIKSLNLPWRVSFPLAHSACSDESRNPSQITRLSGYF